MTYQVLARKWRPQKFKELVGQDHVVRALVNGLDNDRLHHAFLFTGTRGVGKTTIARIFAKSLNCEKGVSSEPCGECSTCLEINEGRFVDLIEVDAASRTKVDETRELLENVQYSPTRGRYKVYLIDEVHMFSNHSFNALLKTLEEPPPHVKFLLATTDPQKLPVTILSRCLQFNLKRLLLDEISQYLSALLVDEGISADPQAIQLIARGADGSMRDALSLLDQAIAFGGGKLEEAEVRAMMGSIEHRYVFDLLDAIANDDADQLLARLNEMVVHSPDYESLLGDILVLLHQVAIQQTGNELPGEVVTDLAALQSLADKMSPEDVQLYYQIGLIGRRDLQLAPDPRTGMEMVMLRMLAFRPDSSGRPSTAGSSSSKPASSVPTNKAAPAASLSTQTAVSTQQPAQNTRPQTQSGAQENPSGDWNQLIEKLGLTAMSKQLAMNCTLLERNERVLKLGLNKDREHLRTPSVEERLTLAVKDVLGLKLEFVSGDKDGAAVETPAQAQARAESERSKAAVEAINQDSTVRALQEKFGAEVVSESIRPVDQSN